MGGLGSVSVRAARARRPLAARAHGRHRPSRARLPRLPVRGLEDRPRRLLRDGQRAGPRADPRRGALRRPRRRRARERRGPLPRDARRAAGGARGLRGRARRRGAGRPHAAVRADGEPRRRRPDRRAHRRDRAAQAARARVRRPARRERLRDLPAAAGGARPTRRRSGARTTRSSTAARSSSPSTRPTTSSRRSSSACPSSASEDYGEPFGKVLEEADWDFYAIDPLLFSPAEVRLVSVESGRSFHAGGVRARRPRAVLPGMIVETVTTTINPDGTVNCAAMGVEWGDEEIVIKPYRATRTLRNLERTRRGGRQPHRRHPAVHAGRARGSAPADPAGGRRRRRRARRRLLVARGRGRRDRRDRAAGAGDDARRRPGHAGASSSASTARATRSSRPRSSPRASAGCPRTRSAPSWRAWRSSWTRRPARASGRRWTASWRTCAPRSATDDDGPRRGARAPAHGHARRLRRRDRAGSAGSGWR